MSDFHISNFYILISIFQIREGHYLFSFHSSQIPSIQTISNVFYILDSDTTHQANQTKFSTVVYIFTTFNLSQNLRASLPGKGVRGGTINKAVTIANFLLYQKVSLS